MITVYCYEKCSTCKKALKWLDDNGIEYHLKDIKSDHPDETILKAIHEKSKLPLKKLFNTSGLLYKSMGLAKKLPDMSDDEQFKLLSSDGMLVKRPLVVGDNFVLVGFKETQWSDVESEIKSIISLLLCAI